MKVKKIEKEDHESLAHALRRLARSEDWEDRAAVARHAECEPETLAALVHDVDSHVRRAAISHPACPTRALESVTEDAECEETLIALAAGLLGRR